MVILFCVLLISGILAGQVFDFLAIKDLLGFITSMCLAYIMIEVGLEFSAEKRDIRSYAWDSVVSVSAAVLPAILWFVYFLVCMRSPWPSALLSGLSSAPTSAGILFSMMTAAGLAATWVFKKARTLAVLDDLATILLLTPVQIFIHGFEWQSLVLLVLISLCLFAAFRWQNAIAWPVGEKWILGYAFVLAMISVFFKFKAHIHLEVLIPAFMWGCLVHLPKQRHSQEPKAKIELGSVIKGFFMLLVGLSFPKITLGSISWGAAAGHVLMLTLLANLGKCFPFLCYRKEASVKERLALSFAMFPRGEVGAAVLLISLGYGFSGYVSTLAMLSLGFNLSLTGLFIGIVIKLLQKGQQ